jgi:hypothetical protein
MWLRAGIGDVDSDILAARKRLRDVILPARCFVAAGDRQRASLGHGVARVHREIHERELELVGIDLDGSPFGQYVDLDRDVGTDGLPQEIQHLGNEFLDLDGLELELLYENPLWSCPACAAGT